MGTPTLFSSTTEVKGRLEALYSGPKRTGKRAPGIMSHPVDDERLQMRPPVIGAAYLLAALCLFLPLAVVGSTFAGIALLQRGAREHGVAVLLLGVACTAFGVLALR